jgi:hypothetical protein
MPDNLQSALGRMSSKSSGSIGTKPERPAGACRERDLCKPEQLRRSASTRGTIWISEDSRNLLRLRCRHQRAPAERQQCYKRILMIATPAPVGEGSRWRWLVREFLDLWPANSGGHRRLRVGRHTSTGHARGRFATATANASPDPTRVGRDRGRRRRERRRDGRPRAHPS